MEGTEDYRSTPCAGVVASGYTRRRARHPGDHRARCCETPNQALYLQALGRVGQRDVALGRTRTMTTPIADTISIPWTQTQAAATRPRTGLPSTSTT